MSLTISKFHLPQVKVTVSLTTGKFHLPQVKVTVGEFDYTGYHPPSSLCIGTAWFIRYIYT